MNKIIVYEHSNFRGMSKEFTSDVRNLVNENFNDCISSLKVIGNPWVAYEHADFDGADCVYEEGEYSIVEYNNIISSLQLVTEDLNDPQITLYEHINYEGRSLVLNCETNLAYGHFNDATSSHKVQRGAWILYQHNDRGGFAYVARAGRNIYDYRDFNDQLTHLRPLKAGRPYVKAEIQWDKKEENCVNKVMIDSITGVNYGSEMQSFTTERSREYSASVIESFKFSDSTEISWGVKFGLSFFGVTAETSYNSKDTFIVERGGSNTRTMTESVKVSLPARIPPHTKLTVNMIRKEVIITVPVKLIITTGFHNKVEYGQYRCERGNSISTEFKEEKI